MNAGSSNARSLDEEFEFILPQMRAAKGPISAERRRLLVVQAIAGGGKGASQVMLKITSFCSSAEHLAAHTDYVSRNGDIEVFDRDGDRLSQFADSENGISRRESIQLYARELLAEQKSQNKKMGRPRTRVSMNLMLSMPPGTDRKGFELAVSEFLSQAYDNFDYFYAFHDDRDHYHAHVVVGLKGKDGRWLNPRKNDITQWRQGFAASLQRRGIAAKATPSYTRGKRKSGYRRDHRELETRGTRRAPRPAPTYDPAKEDAAIEERRQAWTRIEGHYRGAGDALFADSIAEYVAANFTSTRAKERAAPSPSRSGRGR